MKLALVLLLLVFPMALNPVRATERTWVEEEGFRWAKLEPFQESEPGFTRLPAEPTGITFVNRLSEERIAANRVLANGSGVAIGDFDNDGLPDIYFCGLETPNALYKNLGNWRFQDVTEEAGVACSEYFSRGAVFADLNGNGHLDLLVSTLDRGVLCFLNDGRGRFVNHTQAAGTASDRGSTTLALADVDGNGTLDLYVANNRPDDIRDRGRVSIPMIGGKPVIPPQYRNRLLLRDGQLAEYGQPDQLLLNDGAGRFTEVSWTGGMFLDEAGNPLTEPPLDWGLTATFRDVNNNSAPDLYVCNDFWTQDRFWINDGAGRFQAVPGTALRKTSASSMGVDFADLDRSGHFDFFVIDMLSRDQRLRKRQVLAQRPKVAPIGADNHRPQAMRNTLFRNRGDGTFAELADYAGVAASDWSWSALFLDVDLSGYEDLLISAGHFRDVQDLDAELLIRSRQRSWAEFTDEAARQAAFTRELMEHYRLYPPLEMPIVSFRNLGHWQFTETTDSWGLNEPGVHHGMALGDLDGDGDLDLVVNSLNRPALLFRNNAAEPRLAVRLEGRPPNTQAIGARVTLRGGAVPVQTTEIVSGGRYLSGSEAIAVFATGPAASAMTLEVRWRDGRRSVLAGVQPNRIYEIAETHSQALPSEAPSAPSPVFEDVSHLLGHVHHETEFNDFERQPLLPFKFSQGGPGVAWFDLTGDGRDELIIGSGRGGSLAVFQSRPNGAFQRLDGTAAGRVPDDLAGMTGWRDPEGNGALLAGITGYEHSLEQPALAYRLEDDQLSATSPLTGAQSTAGPLALGDLGGDGRLALFIGGGVSPGNYPAGAPSRIYRYDGKRWQVDSRNSLLLENLGIVNGAVWSDLTGNGLPELILACEWGPVRVFKNRGGVLFEATEEFGLAPYTGWWKGVTTGDVNNNGRLDIIASNWGLNSPYRAGPERPLIFYYGQLAQPGVVEIIETEYSGGNGRLAPRRQLPPLANSMPFFLERFTSHKAFSEATLDEALGDRAVLARSVQVATLASTVFLNLGERFQAVELPREAQLAPAFSVQVADLDGDGNEDLFLSQNFFATQPELPPLDAGRALWLRGDGAGGFAAVPGVESGLAVYGEQRGAAWADFDEDGRVDLVISQNGGATKLYRNRAARPGLRVRLEGPRGNPHGVGAVMRLQFSHGQGPARTVHAGSGYWSQNSMVQVLGLPEPPQALRVRWPGGSETTTPLTGMEREITVNLEGKLIRSR